MTNTIELLESIGKDASLRHATATELEKLLAGMQASDELKRAACTGNAEPLKQELGHRMMNVNNNVPEAPYPDDDGDEDEVNQIKTSS